MSNSLPLVWLWDCCPLAADAWGNVQGVCDYVGTERRILIRRWVDCRPSAIANPPPQYRPAYAPLPPLFVDGGARWCYVPTEADIARVRELLPDCLTPERPAWYEVEARLVAAGHSPRDLAAMHPVALLTLLAAANPNGPSEALGQGESAPQTKLKRSRVPGEAEPRLIAALTKHHSYADGDGLNQEPIGVNELAKLAGVAKSTASMFFRKQFKGHAIYRKACRDSATLAAALRLLNNEFRPRYLLSADVADDNR